MIASLQFDWAEWQDFCELQRAIRWRNWDGRTLSLDAYGDLFLSARQGGSIPSELRGYPEEIFPALDELIRLHRRIRPEGGRISISQHGALRLDRRELFCVFSET